MTPDDLYKMRLHSLRKKMSAARTKIDLHRITMVRARVSGMDTEMISAMSEEMIKLKTVYNNAKTDCVIFVTEKHIDELGRI